MKSIIKVISWAAFIVGLAFLINNKLNLHIGFLEVKTMNSLYIFGGCVIVGIVGLFLTKDS